MLALSLPIVKNSRESGVAMVTALLTLLVLSTLAAGFIFVTQSEIWSTSNYKTLSQARYLADAGAERTLDWIRYTYAPPPGVAWDTTKYPVRSNGSEVVLSAIDGEASNYPDAAIAQSYFDRLNNQSVTTTGLAGTYSTKATLLSIQVVTDLLTQQISSLDTWRITSRSKVTGYRGSALDVEQIVERGGVPVFNYTIYTTGTGCQITNMSGAGGLTDSFDSSLGNYSLTHTNTNGNIGSNGNTNLSGTTVYGALTTPLQKVDPSGCSGADPSELNTSGSASVKEGIRIQPPPDYPIPPPVDPAPTTATFSSFSRSASAAATVNFGQYYNSNSNAILGDIGDGITSGRAQNIVVTGGKSLVVRAGTYNINSVTMSGGGRFRILTGPVVVNLAGNGTLTSGSVLNLSGASIANPTGLPSNLRFVYRGTASMSFSGGSDAYALVYAPNAPVTISGNGDWYGAFVSSKFTASGGSRFHYDRVLLGNFYYVGPYRTLSYSRSKF